MQNLLKKLQSLGLPIEKASNLVNTNLKKAIVLAKANIEKFHSAQKT